MRANHNQSAENSELISAQIDSPFFLKLLNLWRSWPQDRGRNLMREDLDFLEDADWKPHLAILDIIRNGSDGRFRLMGRSCIEGLGRNATGECLSSLPQCTLKTNYKPVMDHITRKSTPFYLQPMPISPRPRRSYVIEQLHLPLNMLDGRPHMILSAFRLDKTVDVGGEPPYPVEAA